MGRKRAHIGGDTNSWRWIVDGSIIGCWCRFESEKFFSVGLKWNNCALASASTRIIIRNLIIWQAIWLDLMHWLMVKPIDAGGCFNIPGGLHLKRQKQYCHLNYADIANPYYDKYSSRKLPPLCLNTRSNKSAMEKGIGSEVFKLRIQEASLKNDRLYEITTFKKEKATIQLLYS